MDFKITSSKNLKFELFFNKINSIFLVLSKKPSLCILCTTNGVKIFLEINRNKKKNYKFFNHGMIIKQKFLICYFITNSNIFSEKIFFSIESFLFFPYSKFLVFYKYKNNGIVKKKIFSRLENTAYLIIPIPKIEKIDEQLMILSKGKLLLINYTIKIQFSLIFPLKKIRKKYFQPLVISSCFFITRKKIIFFFSTREGDIFKLSIENLSKPFHRKNRLKIHYFDTLTWDLKNIGVMSNGFFYGVLKSGKILIYRFINLKNEVKIQNGYFSPNFFPKNLIIVDQLCLISKITSIIDESILNKFSKSSLFFCGTKNQSSIRLLEKISTVISIFTKPLNHKPVGLYVTEVRKNYLYLFVSFRFSTISFLFEKKIEEFNQLRITADSVTISIIYSRFLDSIIQITPKSIKLIKNNQKDKKICQWITNSKVLIRRSIQNSQEEPYILVLLSSNKIILIEITKNDYFLELKCWSLENFEKNSLILNCYISSKNQDFKFLFLGTKKERTIRIYKILPDLSTILIGIQLLDWAPESIFIFKDKKVVFFLITLNNGTLLKTTFCSKKNKLKFLQFLNISKNPLYFPDNFSPINSIIFGDKVWKIVNEWTKSFNVQLICEKTVNFLESFGNFLIVLIEKELKILLHQNKPRISLNNFGYNYSFTVTDSCLVRGSNVKIILTINNDNLSSAIDHEMNLFFSVNQRNLRSISSGYHKKNFSSCISIIEFVKNTDLKKCHIITQNGFFLIKTSSGNFFLNSITKKKSSIGRKHIFLVSRIFKTGYFPNIGVISLMDEKSNQNISILSILLKNCIKFGSEIGGKYRKRLKLNFLFEEIIAYQNLNGQNNFLSSFLVGSRFIFWKENEIKIIEITKENFKTIQIINLSYLNFKNLKVSGNKIYLLEIFRGMKSFHFKNKGKLIIGTNLLDNFFISDIFIFNPLKILSLDLFKNLFLYTVNKLKSNCLSKNEKEKLKISLFLKFKDLEKFKSNIIFENIQKIKSL
jgi:hypothetical protein